MNLRRKKQNRTRIAFVLFLWLVCLLGITGCCSTQIKPISESFSYKLTTCGYVHPYRNLKLYYQAQNGRKTVVWPALFAGDDDLVFVGDMALMAAGFPDPNHASMERRLVIFKAPVSRVDITDWVIQRVTRDARLDSTKTLKHDPVTLRFSKTTNGFDFTMLAFERSAEGAQMWNKSKTLQTHVDFDTFPNLIDEAIKQGVKQKVMGVEFYSYPSK